MGLCFYLSILVRRSENFEIGSRKINILEFKEKGWKLVRLIKEKWIEKEKKEQCSISLWVNNNNKLKNIEGIDEYYSKRYFIK
jgi:hypothetical protein